MKFRAYDKKRKEVVYFDFDTFSNESKAFYEEQIKGNRIDIAIGQKDKCGADIYSGDIVSWQNVTGYETDGEAVIVYLKNHAAFYLENDTLNIYDTVYDFEGEMTVVGNVYQLSESELEEYITQS